MLPSSCRLPVTATNTLTRRFYRAIYSVTCQQTRRLSNSTPLIKIYQKTMDAIQEISPTKLEVVTHRQYDAQYTLSPQNVAASPLDQFRSWFKDIQGIVDEPEAMSISTSTASGIPSSRFVLLKQVDERGFIFYTNYTSRKSRELTENPHAALAFYWREVHRQVRVVGRVEKVSKEESEAYYKSRPVGSRIGAWASPQSSVVEDEEVSRRVDKYKEEFQISNDTKEADIPLPEFWGGWRVIPDEVEFWAGKPSRLHDRIRYLRLEKSEDRWQIDRLAP